MIFLKNNYQLNFFFILLKYKLIYSLRNLKFKKKNLYLIYLKFLKNFIEKHYFFIDKN